MNDISPLALPPKYGWLLNRSFALLWSGQLISVTGDYLFYTTIDLWIAHLSGLYAWTQFRETGDQTERTDEKKTHEERTPVL